MIGDIGKLGLVKDVNMDLSYQRGLLGEESRGRDRVGAFVDGKKRPGKIFTAMSFSEGDGEGQNYSGMRNSSIKWGRQLLMQVVLSLLFPEMGFYFWNLDIQGQNILSILGVLLCSAIHVIVAEVSSYFLVWSGCSLVERV